MVGRCGRYRAQAGETCCRGLTFVVGDKRIDGGKRQRRRYMDRIESAQHRLRQRSRCDKYSLIERSSGKGVEHVVGLLEKLVE